MLHNLTVKIVCIKTRWRSRSRIGREFRRDNRKARAARDDDWAKQNGRGENIVAWSRDYRTIVSD
jgi:hypothetical protein